MADSATYRQVLQSIIDSGSDDHCAIYDGRALCRASTLLSRLQCNGCNSMLDAGAAIVGDMLATLDGDKVKYKTIFRGSWISPVTFQLSVDVIIACDLSCYITAASDYTGDAPHTLSGPIRGITLPSCQESDADMLAVMSRLHNYARQCIDVTLRPCLVIGDKYYDLHPYRDMY